ncbi:MAG: CPBP family glutamic-type intramembrane protease [Erythrobacter sp.]
MNTLSTSPPAAPLAPANIRSEWTRFASFLARPHLPDDAVQSHGAIGATLRMLALDLPIMVLLIGGLGVAASMGFEVPDNANNQLEPGLLTFALVALVVPLLEELAFRSWLNGRPWVIAMVVISLIGFLGVPALMTLLAQNAEPSPALITGPAIALIAAPLAAIFLFKRPVPGLFVRGFPLFFWFSTVAFALVHLANYTNGFQPVLLLLVLPQFALGAMLGYLRVHYGLVSAVALHALHNGLLFSLAMAGKAAEASGAA